MRTVSELLLFYSHLGIYCLDNDMVMMFEEAYKKQPGNEDLGAQTFFANVRASHWKSAHNVRFLVLLLPVTES